MSTLDRIAELQREAEAAIAGANDPEQLEELRLRYLGRKSRAPVAAAQRRLSSRRASAQRSAPPPTRHASSSRR
jgi:hypothetical protein